MQAVFGQSMQDARKDSCRRLEKLITKLARFRGLGLNPPPLHQRLVFEGGSARAIRPLR